ncbi:MAG: DUF4143 domain-containing protein [Planctomycetota bacterium]
MEAVLETSRVLYLLPPHHRNYGKRIVKSPKVFLLDVGLATFVLGLHTKKAILQGPTLGALVETAVLGEWIKAFGQLGQRPHLFFWRSSGGHEVDLIIVHDNRLYALEVKATATPTPPMALARSLELAGPEAAGALACQVDEPCALRPGIRAVPWHLGW